MSGPSNQEDWHPIRVETYSGGRLHERPRRFFWGGRWQEVQAVLGQWRSPGRLIFQVRDAGSRVYLLRYDLGSDGWEARLCPAGEEDAAFRHL